MDGVNNLVKKQVSCMDDSLLDGLQLENIVDFENMGNIVQDLCMMNYMEKGVILQRMVCKVLHANLVLIPKAKKEMKMILERVMRRFGCRKILNNMKREINKLMGVNMMM